MTRSSLSEIESRFEKSQNDLVLQSSDFSLQGLSDMVNNEVIDLAPKYQRRERWGPDRQSELIESFLLNIPVPPIYLAEESYGVYSIIDGKQRITAVSEFLDNRFALRGLEAFTEINGSRFSDLPQSLRHSLTVRPYFRVITLLKQSEPELKFEVFLRLNRGGVQLNSQEIRNVAFRGHLNDAIYDASENHLLRQALNITGRRSKAFQKMQDAEWVLRFLTLKDSWDQFSGSLSNSLDNFMLDHSSISERDANHLAEDFESTISNAHRIWGDHFFQRWDGSKWRNQALAGMYDAQMISTYFLPSKKVESLADKQAKVISATKTLFKNEDFEEAVRLGTNTPSRLKYRVETVCRTLEKLV